MKTALKLVVGGILTSLGIGLYLSAPLDITTTQMVVSNALFLIGVILIFSVLWGMISDEE